MLSTVTKGMNYIGGRWAVAAGETFEDRNPASTGELLGVFPRSGLQEVEGAVAAARAALQDWRRESRIRRAEYLDAFVQLVKRDQEELARLLSKESSKCIAGGSRRCGGGDSHRPVLVWQGAHRVGGGAGIGDTGEGHLRPPEAQGGSGGHHALEFPLRHTAVAHLPIDYRGQHGGIQAR